MKRHLIEIGKDICIFLLTIAVLVLALLALPSRTLASIPWLSAAVKPFAGILGLSAAELTYTEQASPTLDASQPLAISVRNSAGRFSAQYDFDALDSLYESLGRTLGQALESAESMEETTLQKFYSALSGTGVAFLYPTDILSDVLASWLDAQPQETGNAASVYILSVQESRNVRLYLYGNACWVCDTTIPGETLLQALDGYRPDGSFFALEDSSALYARLDPLSLICPAAPALSEADSANPCDSRFVTSLASTLGFNPYGDASYTDADGNSFFSESDATLRVFNDGYLLLSVDEDAVRFSAASDDAGSLIETARALLQQITDALQTDARLYLSDFIQTETGAICAFDYVVDGVPVLQNGSGSAITVTFSGAHLTELSMPLRSYQTRTQTYALIPAAQAAAIVPENCRLRIFYDDTGVGALDAGWRTE